MYKYIRYIIYLQFVTTYLTYRGTLKTEITEITEIEIGFGVFGPISQPSCSTDPLYVVSRTG